MKKNIKNLFYYIIMIISCGVIGFSSYTLINHFFSNKNEYNTIDNWNTEAYSKVKSESKKNLLNSTFSVRLEYTIPSTSMRYQSWGTAWSFAYENNSWYLMTNFHVVQDYIYYTYPENPVPRVNSEHIKLYNQPYNETNSQSIEIRNEVPIGLCSIQIITDNSFDDSVKLFSDKTETNWYSLDMALIKISGINQEIQQMLNDTSKLPYSLYKTSQKSFMYSDISSRQVMIGGFPYRNEVESDYYIPNYFLEVINPTTYESEDYWNIKFPKDSNENISYPRSVNEASSYYGIKQRGSIGITKKYFIEKGVLTNWYLSAGSSGSPVYLVDDYELNEPLSWVPFAIYWGGLSSGEEKFFQPSFTFFISNIANSKYNVYENFKNYISTI